MTAKSVVIFSDTDGLHEARLTEAFAGYGLGCKRVSLVDCKINYAANEHNAATRGLSIPGFEAQLPHAAFVRAVPAGSFEQVTFRLDVLHALEECGVLVYNCARAIERTVDKGMTSFLLARANIASPETWVCESRETAMDITGRVTGKGDKLVLKPLFGNCGRGLQLIDAALQLPAEEDVNGVYYLQRFIGRNKQQGRDWRVLVIADRAVAAMERISEHWITNRARGGKCLPAVLTPEIRELAEAATRCIGMAYAGVDIMRDEQGRFMVLEVNSVPAWRGLQSVVDMDISRLLAEDIVARLESPGLMSTLLK